jgi:hypothetical protein
LKPLVWVGPVLAMAIWNFCKLLALALTCFVVQKKFFRWTEIPYALPFFIFGLNAAFFWDILSGNISLFEQTLIWVALACLLDRRPVVFAVLLVLAAQIKLVPVLFLALLLVYDAKPRWGIFFAACAGFAAL